MRARVTYAGSVNPGDSVRRGDDYVVVERVKRAQGRKPPEGENLHLVTSGGEVLKLNSTQPVRIIRSA